jgi:phosphoglucosamine mutase
MSKLFGTDGVRGVAGEYPLDRETIRRIGYSLAKRMGEKLGRPPRLVIGRDTRESGGWIMNTFCTGAAGAGAMCESAGVITTPGVAFLTKAFAFDAGVVVSASHNPFEDNGIKVFAPNGRKLEESAERRIELDVAEGKQPDHPGPIEDVDGSRLEEFHAAYIDHLKNAFPKLRLDGKKLVIDCANGAASEFARIVFSHLGADVVTINDKPDGRNINAGCGSLHLDELQSAVRAHSGDVGVAFDGDADRALFVDEQGEIVDGDATLWILAQNLSASKALSGDTVVATVMSNIGLEIALKTRGIKLLRTAVGDKYVLDKLIETGSDLGGEQSGHIIIPKFSLVGDGMMTALFVLEAMFERRQSLSEACAGFVRYPQILVNVKVREKRPFESLQSVQQAAREIEDDLDGTGRLLLRYSGTENLARVMIEGQDQVSINDKAHRLADVIRAELG